MYKKAIYPGTFDPITYGHIDLIERAACLFDEIIVAVAADVEKTLFFSVEKRVEFIQAVFKTQQCVRVKAFFGLLVHFMSEENANIVLRGIRTATDMEYEFRMATTNRYLKPTIETIFLKSNERFSHISSSLVREIAKMGGDLTTFVPPPVILAFEDI